MRKKRRWSETEKARLKQLALDRVETKEIARILKRTNIAVQMAKVRYGYYTPVLFSPDNPLHLAEIIKFKMAGWSLERIAEVYGCCQPHISDLLIKNGFRYFARSKRKSATSQRWNEFDEVLLRRLLKRRLSLERIRNHFPNRTAQAVRMKSEKMTRHWITPEQQEERKQMRSKQLRVW